MYEGNWVNNKRNGDGCFESADGAVYRGGWKNDK